MSKNYPMSNAPEGFPDNLYGYPTVYGIGGDGKPVGSPRLYYDGQTFATPKEISDYKKALAAREVDTVYDVPCTGEIDPVELNEEDWKVFSQVPKLWQNYHTIFSTSPIGKGPQDPGLLGQRVDLDKYDGVLKPYM